MSAEFGKNPDDILKQTLREWQRPPVEKGPRPSSGEILKTLASSITDESYREAMAIPRNRRLERVLNNIEKKAS
jgi:hypothetical protein